MRDAAVDMAVGTAVFALRAVVPDTAERLGLGSTFDPQPIPEVTGNALPANEWTRLLLDRAMRAKSSR